MSTSTGGSRFAGSNDACVGKCSGCGTIVVFNQGDSTARCSKCGMSNSRHQSDAANDRNRSCGNNGCQPHR